MLRSRGQHTGTDGGLGGAVAQDGLTQPPATSQRDLTAAGASLLKPRDVSTENFAADAAEVQPTAHRPIS